MKPIQIKQLKMKPETQTMPSTGNPIPALLAVGAVLGTVAAIKRK